MSRRWDRDMVDVRECGERVHQRVAIKQGSLAQDREVGPGPSSYDEIPILVCVAAPLPAHVEVEHRTGLPSRLAEMTTAARARLFRGEYATVRRVNSGGP